MLNNKTYDILKWFALAFIPAFEVLILTVGKIWAIPYYSEIGATVAAVGVFLAAVLGVSTRKYNWAERDDDDRSDGQEVEP